jgi:hypothetical protein
MKDLYIAFLLLMWFLLTIGLVLSVIGLAILAENERYEKSTWMQIGFDLKDKLIEK